MKEEKIEEELSNLINNYEKFNKDVLLNYKTSYYGRLNEIDKKEDLKTKKGVYIIFSDGQHFVYPKGFSRISYIGQSDNLYGRLDTHKKSMEVAESYIKNENNEMDSYFLYDKYCYMNNYGANVYILEKDEETPSNLEYYLLDAFYCHYFALPVGNKQLPRLKA